jgi:ABC-2 type transport system permease protein
MWQGMVALFAARAQSVAPAPLPTVAVDEVASSVAKEQSGQVTTAQAGQVALFLLTMLLAGMVLSNLVEEKANKIIEVLAASIPMDALFLGKLFAMLGVSLVGVGVWGTAWGGLLLLGIKSLPLLAAPAVGWPLFLAWALPISPWPICCSARCSLRSAAWPRPCAKCRRCRCR